MNTTKNTTKNDIERRALEVAGDDIRERAEEAARHLAAASEAFARGVEEAQKSLTEFVRVLAANPRLAGTIGAEDAADTAIAEKVAAQLATGEEELIPSDLVDRLLAGDETPVCVWRKHRGFSQAELARRTGLSQAMISNMDRGENVGSPETLKKVAEVLGVTVDDLLS